MNTYSDKKRGFWPLFGGAAIIGALLGGAWVRSMQPVQARAPKTKKSAVSQVMAPELVGDHWLNTAGGKPITLAGRRGKVTIVEFWTFACSNCRANLPAYEKWQKNLAAQGVEVIGVHTPETDAEREPKNVAQFVKEQGITYPILLDNDGENWRRWKQQYWPAIYVLDKAGRVRYRWTGELRDNEAQVTTVIRQLAEEAAPSTTGLKAVKPTAAGSTRKGLVLVSTQGAKVGKVTRTDAEWRALLPAASYDVLRHEGTERAFSGDYEFHGDGIYRCEGCGLPLFVANTQFDSGTGWPSFYRAIPGHVVEKVDNTFGMARTEVECARCGGHLGHVFDDGPAPTGLRYCMNSVALKFEADK